MDITITFWVLYSLIMIISKFLFNKIISYTIYNAYRVEAIYAQTHNAKDITLECLKRFILIFDINIPWVFLLDLRKQNLSLATPVLFVISVSCCPDTILLRSEYSHSPRGGVIGGSRDSIL